MNKLLVVLLLASFAHQAFGADVKYPVSTIPEDLKQGMYAVVREEESKIEIISKSSSTQYERIVITILNSKAKDLATMTAWYDKLSKIEFFRATVYDAEGNLIKKLKQHEIVDQSAVSGGTLFDDDRIKYADLSQSTYPYTVEFEWKKTNNYLFSLPGFSLYTDDEVSCQKTRYSITYPKDLKPRYRLSRIDEPKIGIETDNKESLTWMFENVKPTKFESFSQNAIVPNIMVSPTKFEYSGYAGSMETWQEFGKWIALLNKGRNNLPDATKQKAKELTANLKTTEEKAKVLYTYMQNKTRYVSIQLGIGGFQPFDAAVVDGTGYGDCKALSNYMVSLLEAVGVKAHYVLIYAGKNAPPMNTEFSSSQFNHAVVAVPNGRDTLWLECTSQTNPFGYAGNFTGDRKALMITNDGASVVKTIYYSADQNTQVRSADVFLQQTGDGTAKVKTTYSGTQYENDNLDYYLNNQYDEQRKWLQKTTGIPSFDITSFNMINKKEKIPSAVVTVDLSLKRLATISGKRLFLTPNLMNRSSYIPDKTESRKTNVVTRDAHTAIDTIRYNLPEGIYPEFMPAPTVIKSKFGEYESSYKLDQNKLVYIRRVRTIKGVFPPEAYEELVNFYRSISKADNTKMVFLSKT